MMSNQDLKHSILEQVTDQAYQPQSLEQLAQAIGIGERQYGKYRDAVKALHQMGRVVIGGQDMVLPPLPPGKFIGKYRANPRGFGFVIPESPTAHGDAYVPAGNQLDAVTGDTVLAKVSKKGKRDGRMIYEARITQIIQRGNNRYVGRLQKTGKRWFVLPEGNTLHVPIQIKDATTRSAQVNSQVVVEIIQYPSQDTPAQGVIVEVLGIHGEPEVDTLSIIHQYNLPRDFPKQCLDQARKAAQSYKPATETQHRQDLTAETIITIDPDDAKDYDDAISITRKKGEWELGVHIADVSHFVVPNSDLDKEARLRGNSVYFPGLVIPMLPELLSNGVCSLQEGEPRLVKSAFITYDSRGEVSGQRFSNSMIKSAKRLTYQEATHILEGRTGGFPAEVIDLIRQMEELARIIQKRRVAEGMLSLDLPSVEPIFNDAGELTGVTPEDQSYSHTIIEMFMVEANEAVARLFAGMKVPHLRRIHPPPEETPENSTVTFLKALGYRIPSNMDRKKIQRVLESVKGKPEALTVNLAILRSMQQAEYSPQLLGHYALASDHYAHFTSPIRRYPDLIIHRLLNQYLMGELETKAERLSAPSTVDLTELGGHCSFTERRSEDAERELMKIKILRLLENRLGDDFKGVVTGVTNFGVYVQLDEYLIDGLIRFEALADDWWEVLPEAGCVIGERSGRRITIGDIVEVTISRIDIPARHLDLQLKKQISTRKPLRKKTSKKSSARASAKTKKPRSKGRKTRRKAR